MPADPLLNERAILASLQAEHAPITPNGLRSLMSVVLLSCYDRKVDREFFADMLDLHAMMGIDLSDMESAGKLRAVYVATHPGKEPVAIDGEISKIIQGFMAKRRRMATQYALVAECPTLDDTIS